MNVKKKSFIWMMKYKENWKPVKKGHGTLFFGAHAFDLC